MPRAQSRTEKKAGDRKDSEPQKPVSKKKKADELKAEMDSVMDEIDEVLQENAEEFVKAYVQRGGQ